MLLLSCFCPMSESFKQMYTFYVKGTLKHANPVARVQLQSRERQGQESQLQSTQSGEPVSSSTKQPCTALPGIYGTEAKPDV